MDRLDFEQLRVLIVGGRPYAVGTLKTAFDLAGVRRVSAVADGDRALVVLRDRMVDAVFCDDGVEPVDGVPFPLAARRSEGLVNPLVPVFLVCGGAPRRAVERARDDGITDVLARPVSAATVMRKLSAACRTPRPFIVSSAFFGPDRRSAVRGPFAGTDRRQRQPSKVRLPHGEPLSLLSRRDEPAFLLED